MMKSLVIFLALALLSFSMISCGGGGGGSSSDNPDPGLQDTTAPSIPTGLIVKAASDTQINLSWTASTDDTGVAGYKMYRDSSATALKDVTGTSTSDTGLTASTTYCYEVMAYDAAGNESSKSVQQCATTLSAPDTTAPSVPIGLTVTVVSSMQVDLSWTASTDDTGVAGYKIYRDGAATALKDVTSTSTSDTGLTATTDYCYEVTAYDTAGNESNKSAQVCETTLVWPKVFGGTGNDTAYSVRQTATGGYVLSGRTDSFGADEGDVYFIQTDASGTIFREKTFGGTNPDLGKSIQRTSDGGYVITGYTGPHGSYNVYLTKIDYLGRQSWSNMFGISGNQVGLSVQQTSDGGYIIAGYTSSGSYDIYLIKTDSNGNAVWEKTFGGTGYDEGQSVRQTTDGGYIVTGYTWSYSSGSYDVYLIKTDSDGNAVWEKTFGGMGHDYGYSVQQTTDGGYIIAGDTASYGAGSLDVYLIKTDSSGNATWEKTFGGVASDHGYSVQQTTDDGYVIAGDSNSFGAGKSDVYLVKTDASGTLLWEKTYGGTDREDGKSVQQTSDGGYIIAGFTMSFGAGDFDVYLIKTDANGNLQ